LLLFFYFCLFLKYLLVFRFIYGFQIFIIVSNYSSDFFFKHPYLHPTVSGINYVSDFVSFLSGRLPFDSLRIDTISSAFSFSYIFFDPAVFDTYYFKSGLFLRFFKSFSRFSKFFKLFRFSTTFSPTFSSFALREFGVESDFLGFSPIFGYWMKYNFFFLGDLGNFSVRFNSKRSVVSRIFSPYFLSVLFPRFYISSCFFYSNFFSFFPYSYFFFYPAHDPYQVAFLSNRNDLNYSGFSLFQLFGMSLDYLEFFSAVFFRYFCNHVFDYLVNAFLYIFLLNSFIFRSVYYRFDKIRIERRFSKFFDQFCYYGFDRINYFFGCGIFDFHSDILVSFFRPSVYYSSVFSYSIIFKGDFCNFSPVLIFSYEGSNFLVLLISFLSYLFLVLPILLSVAFTTLLERKVLAAIQRRFGPDQVGYRGFLQPIADAGKLLFKEVVLPFSVEKVGFFLAPIIAFFLALLSWSVIPCGNFGAIIQFEFGIFFIFCVSSLAVYSIILAGWSSGSKYPLFGALRAAAQMISYEVSFALTLFPIILLVGSFDFLEIVLFQERSCPFFIPFLPLAGVFFISSLAETNRPPFDLPEAEAELVSGYNVEYSSIGFALFFIAEYSNIILMSSLNVIFFWGGWSFFSVLDFGEFFNTFFESVIFGLRVSVFVFFFIWVRAILPRYRYDQLMYLGWKVFLPFVLGYTFFVISLLLL